ncbi:hypothetical protein COT72_02405 [archaeon CG10_big_fil_rev_8_21_14_0_10_43_11]|nr:MAG: hypothetical protein COT72_02405 [archaeon CG10_big_fil_rev_8_21_14_0_10_43_11]
MERVNLIFHAAVSLSALVAMPLVGMILVSFVRDKKISLETYRILVSAALFLVAGFVFNEIFSYSLGFKLVELIVIFHLFLAGYQHLKPRLRVQKKKRGRGKKR